MFQYFKNWMKNEGELGEGCHMETQKNEANAGHPQRL